MGEGVVVSGEKGMEVRLQTEEEQSQAKQQKDDGSEEMVRWNKFLPRMVLGVLLVEADDSTRQIITALLRKCSYRVAAVSDGLKAWETLKRKAPDIDLILTEVELPSISGFALLTLIKEHDICKNIPVIMMSSHDSISMSLKCILKGAADFLIKPVRRNVLMTLWQHVWRSHPEKIEATSENNDASNHSTGSVASIKKDNEYSEKGCEAQVTFQARSSSNFSNIDTARYKESTKLERESVIHNDGTTKRSITSASEAARCDRTGDWTDLRLEQDHNCAETKKQEEALRSELIRENPNYDTEIHGYKNELVEPSSGAIDFIAAFENLPNNAADKNCSLNDGGTNKFDFDPQLELSLRNFSGSSCTEESDERQTLNHSNASVFSWYDSHKLLQPLFPALSVDSAKAYHTELNSQNSTEIPETDTSHQYGGTNRIQENVITTVNGQSGQVETQLPSGHLQSLPATGVTSDHMSRAYGNVMPSVFYTQSGAYHIWSPKPVFQKENSTFPSSTSFQSNAESHNSEQHYHWSDDATCASLDQKTAPDKSYLDPATHDYPAAGQNTSDSLGHETAYHINNGSYGSIDSRKDGNCTSAAVVEKSPESLSDHGHLDYDKYRGADSQRPSQREAALTKFRRKRKERCYEKKVRYQSRKRLAEQRPRIKGQFVRQVQNDSPVADSGGDP